MPRRKGTHNADYDELLIGLTPGTISAFPSSLHSATLALI